MKNNTRLVQGVGVNDASYPVRMTGLVSGRAKTLWECQFYRVWSGMFQRCYSDKFQSRQPTYVGCTVSPEWHYFSSFRSWMIEQEWEGKELDKDILMPGNKVYSSDACVFVPGSLNTFLNDCGAARGDNPVGVYFHKQAGKYQAKCSNPFSGKREHLGLFTDAAGAHEAWRKRKHEHACRYAGMQSDQRVAAALRSRYALRPAHRLDE